MSWNGNNILFDILSEQYTLTPANYVMVINQKTSKTYLVLQVIFCR